LWARPRRSFDAETSTVLRAILRLLFALGGAALAAILVALLEARVIASAAMEAGEQPLPPMGGLVVAELGLLSPVALGVGAGVGALMLLVHPSGVIDPIQALGRLREAAVLDRLRAAAAIPLTILAVFAWCVGTAHVARMAMESGKPAEAGLTVGVGAVGVLLVIGAIALAVLPLLRRLLALGSSSVPQLLDPALTGSIALALVGSLFAIGIMIGDTSGANGGALGIFGVLKRPELDLRPVVNVGLIAFGAFVLPVVLVRLPLADVRGRPDLRPLGAAATAIVLHAVLLLLCRHAGASIGEPPTVARGVEKHAPLGKVALAALRRATDRDKDGFSASFAGGDCNDGDKRMNPAALDVPGNGIDEDCDGVDTPEVAPAPVALTSADAGSLKPKKTFNVILITVDTLRPDLGFMGWDKPTSPNLDRLAEKATVFEQAYSMASYTGKSVGPMLIGKYPSETVTNFSHFNTYYDANVFVTERLKEAGIRTFAGMCHWYFRPSSGLKQGFDVWDTSAIPPGMADNDNSVTSERMADLALKLLAQPENTLGVYPEAADAGAPAAAGETDAGTGKPHRFFAWFHFFDPHAQYVHHEGAPDFTGKGQYATARKLYDEEIWYTDQHIGRVLDYVASQPWADETAIIMTADHGEAFFEHGMMWHGSEIWQELVHVPLLVYVPGAEPRRVSKKRSHIDVAPTILELMGVPLPDDPNALRGRSLLDDVYLPKDAEHEERDVYIDMPQGPHNGMRRAIIFGPSPGMKLIHFGAYNFQLFDLSTDWEERKDLSGDKEKLNEAIKTLNGFRGRLKEIPVKPN
jgi:arylsulfatase A-like enzyme